jgi:hypothetical protein
MGVCWLWMFGLPVLSLFSLSLFVFLFSRGLGGRPFVFFSFLFLLFVLYPERSSYFEGVVVGYN